MKKHKMNSKFFLLFVLNRCEQADKDFEKLSKTHLEYEFVKVDVDAAPQAKGYFAVKVKTQMNLKCKIIQNKGQYTDHFR